MFGRELAHTGAVSAPLKAVQQRRSKGANKMKNKLAFLLVPALGICMSSFTWGQTSPSTSPGTPGAGSSTYPGSSTTPGSTTPATPGVTSPDSTSSTPGAATNSNSTVNSTSPDTEKNDKSTSGSHSGDTNSASPSSTSPSSSSP